MRWAVLIVLAAFCVAGVEVMSDLLVMVGVPEGCRMESERLRAAGSMSGMVGKVSGMGGASTVWGPIAASFEMLSLHEGWKYISEDANPVRGRVCVGYSYGLHDRYSNNPTKCGR